MMTRNQELIKEAKKRGYTHNNFKCLKDLKHTSNPDLNKWYYEGCTDTLFTNSCGNGGKVVYKEGVWAEMIKPIETITPVAMRCTQEQFDAIKPKLKGLKVENISSFNKCIYLANNLGGQEKLISNVTNHAKGDYNRIVHEEWNEEVFLKFCRIEVETIKQTEFLNSKPMVDLMGYSVLVDNTEQARKLQEIAFEQGFTWRIGRKVVNHLGEDSFQFGIGGEKVITYNYGKKHYQDKFITKTAHFNDLFNSNFTPVAMRCTQEQFDAIKPKLKGFTIGSLENFDDVPYLINNRFDIRNNITNYRNPVSKDFNIYEEWNEEVFLKACGIEVESHEEQLRKEAIKRGFVNGVMFYGSEGYDCDKPMLINDNIKYTRENDLNYGLFVNNSWLCFNGKWGTLVEETLEQQLQKAKAEVERLESLIEEENKPKVGDFVKNEYGFIYKLESEKYTANIIKITNPELIKLLEQETI